VIRQVNVTGATLAVREWGDGDGQPVFFWHALGSIVCGSHAGQLVPEVCTRAGGRLVAPDAPGFGASPPLLAERYAIPALAELLWALVDELGLERPVLAGHSWGGVVVCAAAAAAPERCAGLVLLDSGHMDYQDTPSFDAGKTFEEYVARAEEGRFAIEEWDAFWTELEDEVRAPLTEELKDVFRACVREVDGRIVPAADPQAHGAAYHGIASFRVSETWPAIDAARIPVLALLATEPPETRERNEAAVPGFLEAIPHADVVFVEGAGHPLLTDAGGEVGRIIADWL
jgi:pimeloyl-ACP methyl ester carboxylesterase